MDQVNGCSEVMLFIWRTENNLISTEANIDKSVNIAEDGTSQNIYKIVSNYDWLMFVNWLSVRI